MKKRIIALLGAACLVFSLAACSETPAEEMQDAATSDVSDVEETAETTATVSSSSSSSSSSSTAVDVEGSIHEYKSSDLDASYDESDATMVDLSSLSGSTYSVTAGGTYILSGTYAGQILVEVDDADKVQLVLAGATITCADGPAIYVISTDKLILTLADGTENTISDGVGYAQDEEGADGALYSKSDVAINGSGSLTVNGNTAHGIVSKDELVITGGVIIVNSVKDGLRGKDCVAICGGSITVNAGSDGIYSSETDEGKGYVAVDGGTITIVASNDGIQAENDICITGGTVDIQCSGGSSTVTLASDANGFGRSQWNGATISDTSTGSYKGIKAGGYIAIIGGTFNIDTADDAIHAGGVIEITAGDFTLKSGDDAIHSDTDVTISGGSFDIPYCYEGIEGQTITVDDGTIDIVSSDDGMNAAGGSDSSGFNGGWQDTFTVQDNCSITINGGNITIVSDGDCMDSNGALTINGGTLNLTCNGNGNTAIDANGTYSNNGGNITTNDGSESGSGMIGGGMMGGNGGTGGGGHGGSGMGGQPGGMGGGQPQG